MTHAPLPQPLADWAEHLEALQWSALLLDDEWRLVWVSSELMQFVRADENTDLGLGQHVIDAWIKDSWLRTVHPDSAVQMLRDLGPFLLHDFARRGRDPAEVLPDWLVPVLDEIEPVPPAYVWKSWFMHTDPEAPDPREPQYRVNCCFIRVNDDEGHLVGMIGLFYLGVRPNLLALLAAGDEGMYERMARLVEPSARQAAILFCDLHQSGRLSRQLPSVAYFTLIRRLWTGIDRVVADELGIVGKHAGDGASAFFLVDDTGSPSHAAAAAIRAARRIHEVAAEVFRESVDVEFHMKVGLHWGGNLYMGQLVPGGRLDVTALGDEVNEAARLQDCAGPGVTIASKQLVEQLSADDAAGVGIDVEKLLYRALGDLPGASDKAVADAGGLAVTPI